MEMERGSELALKIGPFYDRQQDGVGNLASSTLVCGITDNESSPGVHTSWRGFDFPGHRRVRKKIAVIVGRHRHRQSQRVRASPCELFRKRYDYSSFGQSERRRHHATEFSRRWSGEP